MAQTVKSMKIPWRRKWQLTPVFLPGEPHGQRSLAGYSPWGCKELNSTERLHSLCILYRIQALWKFKPVYRPKKKKKKKTQKERKKNHSPPEKKSLLFCAVMPPSTSTPHSLSQRDFSRISISISNPHLLLLSEMRRKKVKQSYLAFPMCGIFHN